MPDVHGKAARRGSAGAAEALRRVGERVPEWVWLAALTLAAAALVASQALQMDAWLTMTDELQYVRLALSVSEDHSLLPRIHGEASGSYSQLYPVLLSPVYAIFGSLTAFKVAHVLNALLMASTVIPAYLLTRSVVSRRAAAYAVAALAVAIPWMALTLLLWTEPAAYPVFVWAVLALQRALVLPAWPRDAVALLALALAFFARTQFLVLGAAFPAAILLHECGYALTRSGLRSAPAALRTALAQAVTRHWLLVVALAVLGMAALAGPLAALLGPYRTTVGESPLFPAGAVQQAGQNIAIVGVGIGIVPVILGLAWIPLAAVRPTTKAAHAFAVLALLVGFAIVIQASSFTTLYTGGGPQDRYFFYVVPLFLVAAAAFLVDGPRHWAPVLIAALFFGRVVLRASYGLYYAYNASPAAAFHPVLNGRIAQFADALGLEGVTTPIGVRWIVLAIGAVLAAAVRYVPPRRLAASLAVVMVAFGVAQTRYVFDKIIPVQSAKPPDADWVDRAAGERRVAMAPSPILARKDTGSDLVTFLAWWNTEFWNKSVTSVFTYAGARSYTPFPTRPLEIDRRSGRLRGVGLPRLLVTAVRRVDVEPAGHELARHRELKLVDLGPRPHAPWAVEPVTSTGAGPPRPDGSVFRLFRGARRAATGARVTLVVKASPELTRPQRFRVSSADGVRSGRLERGDAVTHVFRLCARTRPARVRIEPVGPVRAAVPLVVLGAVRVTPDRGACSRSR